MGAKRRARVAARRERREARRERREDRRNDKELAEDLQAASIQQSIDTSQAAIEALNQSAIEGGRKTNLMLIFGIISLLASILFYIKKNK